MQDAPYRLIPLRARDRSIRGYAKVDAVDYDWLTRWHWSMSINRGRARAVRGVTIAPYKMRLLGMHRQVMGVGYGDPVQVDHIDGDALNNQRSNLRFADHKLNGQNRRSAYGTSRYRGVCRHRNRWVAQVRLNGVNHWLGSFVIEEEAAAAAAAFRAEHMPYARS